MTPGSANSSTSRRPAIVVTGASTGIGAATALHLDRLGFWVFAGIRKPADGERLVSQALGPLTPVTIDVTDSSSIEAAQAQIAEAVGEAGPAGLVNNAGIVVSGPLELVAISELRRQLEINVIGQVAVTQAFLPLLRRTRGRIVNVGSSSGLLAAPFMGPYAASKFALRALSDSLRLELHAWGMKVSLIEVGPVQTPIWDKSLSAMDARWESASTEGRELYNESYQRMREIGRRRSQRGIPVEQVVAAIEQALTASRPKAHYVVGPVARQFKLLSLLPDALRDWIVLKQVS
ncbi:MAG: SDR family oxidoreductase [Chloroflexi bacterium]|nr:SDR family oxidoreductase [Chloroflexota bacterium]